jgi:predicted Zn-dependent peptidase
MQTPVADARLSVFKRQLLGQVAIARENSNALMLSAAKNYLFLNWIETFDSLKVKINAVTPEHIMQVANEVANVDELYTLTFKSSD